MGPLRRAQCGPDGTTMRRMSTAHVVRRSSACARETRHKRALCIAFKKSFCQQTKLVVTGVETHKLFSTTHCRDVGRAMSSLQTFKLYSGGDTSDGVTCPFSRHRKSSCTVVSGCVSRFWLYTDSAFLLASLWWESSSARRASKFEFPADMAARLLVSWG